MKRIASLTTSTILVLVFIPVVLLAQAPTSDTQALDSAPSQRTVQFPADKSLGPISIEGMGYLGRTDWIEIANAQGEVTLPANKPLRLVIEDLGDYVWPALNSVDSNLFQHLVIQSTSVEPTDLANISKWDLESVQIMSPRMNQFCTINGAALATLRSMPSLKSLRLQMLNLNDNDLAELSRFPALENLQLLGTPHITDVGIISLKNAKSLKSLSLINVNITDAAIESLSTTKSLEEISIDSLRTPSYVEPLRVTDAGLKPLEAMSQLKKLTLPESITDSGLAVLKNLTSLETLVLNSPVTDAALVQLVDCPNLKRVQLERLGNDGVQNLAKMPALESLRILRVEFDETSIPTFQSMKQLKKISIIQEDRPVALIAAMQESLPHCKVIDEMKQLEEGLAKHREQKKP